MNPDHKPYCTGYWSMLVTASLIFAGTLAAHGQQAPVTVSAVAEASYGEYDIKAGFIYKFLSFVTWPSRPSDGGIITIGVLGENPFGNAFSSIDGKTLGSSTINIRLFSRYSDPNELKACQILYIAASEKLNMNNILASISDSPTLTVGDSKGFIDQGGMIGFVKKKNNQVGIEINSVAAEKAGLTIRSMLKRIAIRLIGETE